MNPWRRSHAILAGAILLAAVGLTIAAAGDGTLPGDRALLRFAQDELPAWIDPAMDAANWFGVSELVIPLAFVVALCFWLAGRRPGAVVIAVSPAAWAFFGVLQLVVRSPVPPEEFVRHSEETDAWGFPSGHVLGLTVVAAAVAYALARDARLAARITAFALVCAVCLVTSVGRLYVGAHWPSDVAGAALWAVLWVWGLAWLYGWAEERWDRRQPSH